MNRKIFDRIILIITAFLFATFTFPLILKNSIEYANPIIQLLEIVLIVGFAWCLEAFGVESLALEYSKWKREKKEEKKELK